MNKKTWYQRLHLRPIFPLLMLAVLFIFIVYNHIATEDKLRAKVVMEPDCEELLINRLKIQDDGLDGYYIRAVKRGCNIFSNPQKHAARFVGGNIRCKDCHLDLGMGAETAPLG